MKRRGIVGDRGSRVASDPETKTRGLARGTLSDQVARHLMVAISDQGLQPGDVLPSEAGLAAQYRVGRGAVREALRILQAWGVVRVANGQRAVVRPVTADLVRVYLHWVVTSGVASVRDVLELRRGLERVSAPLAAERATAAQGTELGALVAAMQEAISDISRYVELEYRLHLALASASRNNLLKHLTVSAEPVMKSQMHRELLSLRGDPARLEALHRGHQETVDAILCHDSEGARAAVIREVEEALGRLTAAGDDPGLADLDCALTPAPLEARPSWLKDEPATLAGEIARQLMASIVHQELSPTALLPPEAELAATYNVSRGVIREALRVLGAVGVARTINGRGTVLEPLSPAPLSTFLRWALQMQAISQVEIHEVRVGIEGECAALAAQRITPGEASALDALTVCMKEQVADPAGHGALDLSLHLAIAAASHNPLLEHVVASFHHVIQDLIAGGLEAMHGDLERLEGNYRGHAWVADAVRAHDSAASRRAMEATINFAIGHLDPMTVYGRSAPAPAGPARSDPAMT